MQTRLVDGASSLRAERGTTLVAIGNFDGVHRGHRVVLSAALAEAKRRGLDPLVLTFHPHPTEVLGRGRQATLTTIGRKVELLTRLDPGLRVVVEPFTRELASTSPEQFAEELLVGALGARVVLVGKNFRFGKARVGDLGELERLGAKLGFDAGAEDLTGDERGPFSSSRIREAVAAGTLENAEALLGRPHAVSGVVVEGDRRGRAIGFPTANLGEVAEALPPHGVYACVVDRMTSNGAQRLARGVTNIGNRPTVEAGFSIETHLFDVDQDLYGERLRVHLTKRIRAERKFDGLDALKAQIGKDVAAAKQSVADRSPDPEAGAAWY